LHLLKNALSVSIILFKQTLTARERLPDELVPVPKAVKASHSFEILPSDMAKQFGARDDRRASFLRLMQEDVRGCTMASSR
jgi:hypothetical protein